MLFSLLLSCTYIAPVDLSVEPPGGAISGEIVVSGVDVPSDVIVLVYRAEDPPPPTGTGRPVTFATVPASAFDGAGGLLAANYAVGGLARGDYLITALMDLDGDFSPFDGVAAGATCGDVLGAHIVDLTQPVPAPVSVVGNEWIDDITLVVANAVPFERPAFVFAEQEVTRASTEPQTFRLVPTAVHSALGPDLPLDLNGPCVPSAFSPACESLVPCDTALWARIRDADADGVPDLRPDGLPDVFPRVYLELLADPDWRAEAVPFLAELGAFAQGAPQPLPFGQPLPLAELSVTWLPVARHYVDGGPEIDPRNGRAFELVDLRQAGPDAIPAGAWAVTVVLESGQTWTLPNTLGALGISTQPSVFNPLLQAGALQVQ